MKRTSAPDQRTGKRVARNKAAPVKSQAAAVAGEMKYMDSESGTISIAATTTTWVAGTMADPSTTVNLGSAAVANPLTLCAPTVGSALNQRVGRKITIYKIKVHGTLSVAPQAAQSAADSATKLRLVLVQDTQTNATQMTAAQLFNDAGNAIDTLNSFQNPNNFGRFRVWKDKMVCISNLNLAGGPTTADVIQAGWKGTFKINITFKQPVVVHFNATNGGTVADIVDNSFHIIAGTDNAAYVPQLFYYARVCYKDV